jgi:hypothetical protein
MVHGRIACLFNHVMLSDIFPTGRHATRLAALEPGESMVIWSPRYW